MDKETEDLKRLLEAQRIRRKDRQQATTKRRRMGQDAPKPFSELLNVLFKKDPELLKDIEENKALQAWPRYVGEAAARVSKANRVSKGTLMVAVKDPLWMQQLTFLKQGILQKYRADFPHLGLRDIFFSRNG